MNDTIVIIPARFASSRFPGKPLAKLAGREMILHVCDRVNAAGLNCAVATDDSRIFDTVDNAGYKAVMTSESHRSGTDRVWEAYQKLATPYRVIINVQGDEPFIAESQLRTLVRCFDNDRTQIATLVRKLPEGASFSQLEDPNLVKVSVDNDGFALYFSRFPIPYLRGKDKEEWPRLHEYLTHVGIYGYRPDVLRKITALPQSSLEKAESLEQLRWLQNGFRINTALTEERNIGIDTPDDLRNAEILLRNAID